MIPSSARRVQSGIRLLMDGVLVVLVVTTAFLLGCQELFDSDVWWHVRSGQWIWATGRVPAGPVHLRLSQSSLGRPALAVPVDAGRRAPARGRRGDDSAGVLDLFVDDPDRLDHAASPLADRCDRGLLAAGPGGNELAVRPATGGRFSSGGDGLPDCALSHRSSAGALVAAPSRAGDLGQLARPVRARAPDSGAYLVDHIACSIGRPAPWTRRAMFLEGDGGSIQPAPRWRWCPSAW